MAMLVDSLLMRPASVLHIFTFYCLLRVSQAAGIFSYAGESAPLEGCDLRDLALCGLHCTQDAPGPLLVHPSAAGQCPPGSVRDGGYFCLPLSEQMGVGQRTGRAAGLSPLRARPCLREASHLHLPHPHSPSPPAPSHVHHLLCQKLPFHDVMKEHRSSGDLGCCDRC